MSHAAGSSTTTLSYHDVVDRDAPHASGFPGTDAGRYKLGWRDFRAHLDAIAAATATPPVTAHDVLAGRATTRSWSLTFDDGGASALEIAAELTARCWHGQFFVTTDRIGTPGFLDADGIRELERMGHVVGSHSHTHPQRMSACSPAQMREEWRESAERLAEVLGRRPDIAAVPGGWYSDEAGAAAAAAGIGALYTSEPVRRVRSVDGCLVLGRFALLRDSPAHAAAGLAAGDLLPRARRRAAWLALRPVKRMSGGHYLRIRKALLKLNDG